MSRLNYLSSPMHLFQENLDDTDAVRRQKIASIRQNKLHKSPYSIGSVENVEKKCKDLGDQINGLMSNNEFEFTDSDDEDDEKYVDLEQKSSNIDSDRRHCYKDKKELDKFAGVFSIVSSVRFNKSRRVMKITKISYDPDTKNNSPKKEDKSTSRFIELCKYPGLHGSVIPDLPNSVTVKFILERVLKAQNTNYMKSYEVKLKKWLFSKQIETLVKSMFWFFFIKKYGSEFNKVELPKLFSLAAMDYGEFLDLILDESMYFKDKFQKSLPNVLSQAVYGAISECFHDSWSQFNESFIEDIINMVFFWTSGIRPSKGLWKTWDMHELKPTEQKKKDKAIEEQGRLVQKLLNSNQEKDSVPQSKSVNKVKTESLPIGQTTDSKVVLFNLNGRSPLMQLYLKAKNVNSNKGTNYLIKHLECFPIESSDSNPTYDEIITKSLNDLRDRMDNYKKFQEKSQRDTHKFIQEQRKEDMDSRKNLQKLLVDRREINRLSNLMVHEYLKDKDSVSFRVDEEIQRSINRL